MASESGNQCGWEEMGLEGGRGGVGWKENEISTLQEISKIDASEIQVNQYILVSWNHQI